MIYFWAKSKIMESKTIEITDIQYKPTTKAAVVYATDIDAPRLDIEPETKARLERLGEKIRNRKARY